jgi:hypothetical protein
MFKRPTVQPGQWNVVCDRTGFRLPNTMMQFEWNGLLVYDRVWEERQPQDYLKGIPDNMSVPYGRPNQDPVFITRTVTPEDL